MVAEMPLVKSSFINGLSVDVEDWFQVGAFERVIDRARSAGIEDFFVVSGYRGENLRRELDAFSAREGVRITHIVNDDWDRANGEVRWMTSWDTTEADVDAFVAAIAAELRPSR